MALKLGAPLRVATINVRGLAARRRQYQLSRLFAENELDIVAVQETKVESREQTDRMVQPFRTLFNVCVAHSVGMSGGCCLFIRQSVGITETAVVSCASGRFVLCDFSFSNIEWRVLCVYAPNRERERKVFFEGLSAYLDSDKVIILLGDFNCVCAPEDRANSVRIRDQSALFLNDMVAENALEDVACLSSKGSVQFTHFQGFSHARFQLVCLDSACRSILHRTCNVYPQQLGERARIKFD